jgi:MYXO-CTERM domain-containing protein
MAWLAAVLLIPASGALAGGFEGYELAYRLEGEAASDGFGYDVEALTIAGARSLVVSALWARDGGSTYLCELGRSGASLLSRVDGYNRLGWDVVAVGDVDGDGTQDYAASEYFHGRLHVVSGADRQVGGRWDVHPGVLQSLPLSSYNIGGLTDSGRLIAILRPEGGKACVLDGQTGATVARLLGPPGDYLNDAGDSAGIADLVGDDGVGDMAIVVGDGDEPGKIYLVDGTTTAMDVSVASVAAMTLHGQRTGDCIGRTEGRGQRCVVDILDVTGDGVRDLAVGAWKASVNGPESGSVLIYSGADAAFVYRIDGAAGDDWFGNAVASLEDVDGDGFGDFAIGARGEQNDPKHTGYVYVYSGRERVLLQTLTDQTGCFGAALANVGDLNGDGLADLAISNYYADARAGAVYVYTSIPEPGVVALLALGGLGLIRRRRPRGLP